MLKLCQQVAMYFLRIVKDVCPGAMALLLEDLRVTGLGLAMFRWRLGAGQLEVLFLDRGVRSVQQASYILSFLSLGNA